MGNLSGLRIVMDTTQHCSVCPATARAATRQRTSGRMATRLVMHLRYQTGAVPEFGVFMLIFIETIQEPSYLRTEVCTTMSSKILVTGGAGFIGAHAANELLAHGYSVRALDSLVPQVHGPDQRRPTYLNPDVELIVGDVRDPEA